MSENKCPNPSRLPIMCHHRFIPTEAGSQFVVINILLSLKDKRKHNKKPKDTPNLIRFESTEKCGKVETRKCYDTRMAQGNFPHAAG